MGPIRRVYEKKLLRRSDENGYIRYLCAGDFPGMHAEPFTFRSGENTLRGNFYSYDGCREEELVIFCHGLNGGHRSYMAEIDALCRRGFRVLAWDNTGCFASEGKDIGALSRSLADLECALDALEERGETGEGRKLFLIGHSWGGYAVGSAPGRRTGIDRVVAISGFVSVERALRGFLGDPGHGMKHLLVRRLCRFEREADPERYPASVLDAVDRGTAKFLLAHSEDDAMVPFAWSTGYIRENTKNPDVRYLLCTGRKHNTNYTDDAVAYMNEVLGGLHAQEKARKLRSAEEKREYLKDTDWFRMTRQDEDFWDRVCAFLHEENE